MPAEPAAFHLHLDAERAQVIARLAEGEGTTVTALAEQLLAAAIDAAALDPDAIGRLIDETPGLFERIQASREQGRAGRTIPLSDLVGT